MDAELSQQLVDEACMALMSKTALIAEYDWKISREGQNLYVLLHPKSQPALVFMVRLQCDDYPQRAPSLQFVNPATKETGAQYWPDKGSPFTAAITRNPFALCIPGNREFFENLHKDWQWDPSRYPLARILQDLQIELDKAYQ